MRRIFAIAALCATAAFSPLWPPPPAGGPCVVNQTFSTPGAFVYMACANASLTVEAVGGGSGGGEMSIAHTGGPGGKAASYGAGPLTFVAGATYNVIVGGGGSGNAGIVSNPGTISYVCPVSNVNCTTVLTTCTGTAMANYPNWVCAKNETLNPGDSQGTTIFTGDVGGAGGGGGGSAGGGGGGAGTISGNGTAGFVGGNNCNGIGGLGGPPGGGKGGDGVVCAGVDGSPGVPGSVPGAGGGGGGGGTNAVPGGDGAAGWISIHS